MYALFTHYMFFLLKISFVQIIEFEHLRGFFHFRTLVGTDGKGFKMEVSDSIIQHVKQNSEMQAGAELPYNQGMQPHTLIFLYLHQ